MSASLVQDKIRTRWQMEPCKPIFSNPLLIIFFIFIITQWYYFLQELFALQLVENDKLNSIQLYCKQTYIIYLELYILIKVQSLRVMDEVYLTASEKAKIENQKQVYVLLRLIHFVEKYYSYDRIDKVVYQNQINKLLDKYKRFSLMIPNHNLDSFCKTYNIPPEDLSWAKLVIEKGVSTQQQQNKGGFLFVQATASFIEVLDNMTPVVGQSRNMLQSLQTILTKLSSRLKSPEFNQKFRSFQSQLQNYVFSRSINESMTESEFQEIKLSVQGLYMMMTHLVNN